MAFALGSWKMAKVDKQRASLTLMKRIGNQADGHHRTRQTRAVGVQKRNRRPDAASRDEVRKPGARHAVKWRSGCAAINGHPTIRTMRKHA